MTPKPPPGYQPSDQPPPEAQPVKKPRKQPRKQPPTQTPGNPPEDELFDPSEPFDEGDSEPSAKNAVPDDDAQQAATKLVKEVYGDDYKNAKTPDQKKQLARTLLQKAIETDKDLPGRYVLFKLSRDIAIQAMDGTTAFQAIGEMAKTFAIDALEMKIATLKKLSTVARTAQQHEALARKAMALGDVAMSNEKFPAAKQLNELALQDARNVKEPQVLARVTKQTSRIENVLALYNAAQNAESVLKTKPDDPEANLAVGKYKCFVKADWTHGLAMLAKGSDSDLPVCCVERVWGNRVCR